MTTIRYATLEQVLDSPEFGSHARINRRVLRALASATDTIHGLTHRVFYPEQKTVYFDWPQRYGNSYTLFIDPHSIISLTSLVSGGTAIDAADYMLRRGDDVPGPPYNRIEIDLSSSAAYDIGDTTQQNVAATGLFGEEDTSTAIVAATIGTGINDSVTTVTLAPSSAEYTVGTGSLLLIGTERVVTTARSFVDTTQNLQANLTAVKNDTAVSVSDGTTFAIGEIIAIDNERMLVEDIIGNSLTVIRAYGGTVLAAHTSATDIYAARAFTIERGALGSTAASHDADDEVYVHEYPPLINALSIVETQIEVGIAGKGMKDLRENREWLKTQVYTTYGRKLRLGAV